jgi:hypothetical protein
MFSQGAAKIQDVKHQRRQRLPWEIFRRIMDVVLVARAEVRKHPQAFYQGLRLVGLDGTCFGLQNVPRIVRAMGKATTRRFKEAFARVRVVLLVWNNPRAKSVPRSWQPIRLQTNGG